MNKKNKFVTMCVMLAVMLMVAACRRGNSIEGIVWQWTAMQETVPASQSIVPNPENYTITFNADGSVNIKADCNQVSGTYTMNGSDLAITLGSSTRAFCGEDSQDQIYLTSLGKVSSYAVEADGLQLKFADDAGKMDFANGGEAP
jgi:heat shock protein HslJ